MQRAVQAQQQHEFMRAQRAMALGQLGQAMHAIEERARVEFPELTRPGFDPSKLPPSRLARLAELDSGHRAAAAQAVLNIAQGEQVERQIAQSQQQQFDLWANQ